MRRPGGIPGVTVPPSERGDGKAIRTPEPSPPGFKLVEFDTPLSLMDYLI